MTDTAIEKDDIIKKTTGFSSCFLASTQITLIKRTQKQGCHLVAPKHLIKVYGIES
jgi:hypothetical protein